MARGRSDDCSDAAEEARERGGEGAGESRKRDMLEAMGYRADASGGRIDMDGGATQTLLMVSSLLIRSNL